MARDEERRGISRRTLLIGGGAGIGVVVAWRLWPRHYEPNLRAAEGETLFNAFLKIGRDGRVIVAVPQAELGQGVYTTLPQILADELGADWRTVSVEPAPIGPLYANPLLAGDDSAGDGLPSSLGEVARLAGRGTSRRSALTITGGSTSVRGFEAPLREAGAGARALLMKAAARRWEADWQELDSHDGFVWRGDQRIPFAELAEAAAGEELPDNLPVRGGLEHRLAGQPLPRLDVPAKLDGSAVFAADVRLPAMVYAAVRGAPPGGRLEGYDRAAADRVPGTLNVLANPQWLAAAATNWWAAARALDSMRPRFSAAADLPDGRAIRAALAAALDGGETERVFAAGEVEESLPGASPLDAVYWALPAPSAPVEPLAATARPTGDRMEIWAPTQAPALARAAAARAIGFAEGQVTLYPTLAGGGYGRKIETEAIEQAAVIAHQLGRPVQLTWPRIEEIRRDTVRPPAAARMRAWVGGGTIRSWHARIAAPATVAAVARRLGAGRRSDGAAGASAAGAVPPYGIASVAIDHVPVELAIETGLWRSDAHSYTCFFTECFVDEIARAAGLEPLSFRMQMLGGNPRLARALATATSIGGWDGGVPGSGMGIAAHSAFGSHVAALVEIEIGADQKLRVLRAVCAVDCGRIVNPEVVKQQIEGGLIHGISAATGRPLAYTGGMPAARTIADYGLPTLRDSPEVSVELIDSEEDPGGVTELAVPVAAPAVANALFSLTGRRVRRLPLTGGGG